MSRKRSIDETSQNTEEVIITYLKKGWIDDARILIEKNSTFLDINYKDADGFSMLAYAVNISDTKNARLLIDKGADVHFKDSIGASLLHWAAENGSEEMIRLLLNCGVDIDHVNNEGVSALSYAQQGGHFEAVELLNQCGAGQYLKAIEEINCSNVANINKEICGKHPLYLALKLDKMHDFGMLLGSGAKIGDEIPRLMEEKQCSAEDIEFVRDLMESQKPAAEAEGPKALAIGKKEVGLGEICL